MAEVFIRTHAQGFDIVKPFISVWDTRNLTTGSSADNQIRLRLRPEGVYNFVVDWGDGTSNTITAWNQAETTKTYAVPGIYTVQITGNIRGWRFANAGDRNKIIEVRQCGCLVLLGNGNNKFRNFNNLVWTATDRLMTTSNRFTSMFHFATLANPDISRWDFSGFTLMDWLFYGTSFNRPIDALANARIVNIGGAFGLSPFNQPVNMLRMQDCVDISFMFFANSTFNHSCGAWDIRSVTNAADFRSAGHGFSLANYESTLLGWTGWQDGQATKTIQPNVTFGFGISRVQRYSQAAAARQWMITQRGAIIIDGGDVFIASIQAVVGVDGIIAHMKTALVGVMGETGVQGFVSYLKQIGISLESVVGVQDITPAGTKITTQNLLASVNVAGDIPQGRKTALTTVMGEVFVFGQVAGEMREGTWMLEEVHFTLGNSTGMLTSSTKLYHAQTMRLVITVQDFPSLIGAQVVLRYRHDFGNIQEIKNHVLTPLVLTENTVSVRFNFASGSYLMWLWITFPDGSSLPTSTVKFRVHEEGT